MDKEKKLTVKRFGNVAASLLLVVGMLHINPVTTQVSAKEIGEKNEGQKEACEMVVSGEAPSYRDYSSGDKKTVTWTTGTAPDIVNHEESADDRANSGNEYEYRDDGYSEYEIQYQDVLGNGSVYRGGNARSNQGSGALDDDPNDFASVLPYGDVYFDTSKISFGWSGQAGNYRPSNDGNFTVEILDNAFIWTSYKDGDTNNAGTSYSVPVDKNGNSPTMQIRNGVDNQDYRNAISYVGGLKAYLSNIDGTPNQDYVDALVGDTEWKNTPQEVSSYKYLNTVATDDGFQNIRNAEELDLPYLYRFTFDNAATLPDGTLGNIIITTKKVVLESSIDVAEGAPIGIQQANDIGINMTAINDATGERYIPASVTLQEGEVTDGPKIINTSIGVQVYMDVEVVDQEGNPVTGTISYATNDLDVATSQDFWGRPVGEGATNRRMFTESLTITEGAKSYAVVPSYDHKNALYLQTGWMPMEQDAPLYVGQGTENYKATGVQFGSAGENKLRGNDGTFNLTRRNNGADTLHRYTLLNPNAPENNNNRTLGGDQFNRNRELFAQLGFLTLRDLRQSQPGNTGNTQANIINLTGNYIASRTDQSTFDTGFATLIESEKTSFVWAGSSTGVMGTQLFDTSVFTTVEQTHGTGGGIYLEGYDLNNRTCKPVMLEGSVTMGMNTTVTVTSVPEDGYRVKSIMIGGAGLSNPVTYVLKDLGLEHGVAKIVEMDGYTFEMNEDGTVDVTLPNITATKHVHVDFAADYYFYKVWKDGEPTSLEMTVAPYVYQFVEVELPEGLFTITNRTYYGPDGTEYELDRNDVLTIQVDDATKSYKLEGNNLVNTATGDKYEIVTEYGRDETAETKKFVVTKEDAENTGETHVVQRVEGNNIIWQITYPSEGYTTKNGETWPALPVEAEPDTHQHNHVERNYWFVTEKAPGWALVGYDNTPAKAPGVVSKDYYHDSFWYESAVKDYEVAKSEIETAAEDYKAYMSVFTPGGEITNVPAVLVKATKTWDDLDNVYNNRQDLYMHVDMTIENADGSTTTKLDVLPPQKIAKDAKGTALTVTWGDKSVYDTGDENVIIVSDLSELPTKDGNRRITYRRQPDGSFKGSNNKTYWVNELKKKTEDGLPITYSVRETVDSPNGTNVVAGYTTDSPIEWKDMEKTTTNVDGVLMDTYIGEITNTLELVDVTATKVWDDDNNRDGYRDEVVFTLEGLEGDLPNDQTKEQSIPLNSTLKVEWEGVPKYENGVPVNYKVTEEPLDNYENPIVRTDADKDGNIEVTVTNHHVPEVGAIKVTKTWDDGKNQDGLRKETADIILFKQVEGGPKRTVGDIEPAVVPTEDGEFVYWDNLPLRENGKMISYSIKENVVDLPGYTTTYEGNDTKLALDEIKEIAITNSRTPDVREITIEKVWEDMDDHDGIRPESVTITLKKDYKQINITEADVKPVGSDAAVKETKDIPKTATVGGEEYPVKKDANDVEYFEIDGKYYDPTDNHELIPATQVFTPSSDDEAVTVTETITVDKTKEFDGAEYNVFSNKNGKEYYITFDDEDKETYRDAETDEPLTVEAGVFEPSVTDEIVRVVQEVENPKYVEKDGVQYAVKVDAKGIEYYVKDGKYLNAETDEELVVAEEKFEPSANDEEVIISSEVDKTVAVEGETYVVKEDENGVAYYEKDGKYYDPETNEELTAEVEKDYSDASIEQGIVLSEENDWTETITGLDVNAPEGQVIVYSVEEKEVPEGYTVVVEQLEDGKFTVTNTHNVIINPPTAEPEESIDYKGKTQTGTPTFKADPDTKAPGGGENKIERITLLDEDGNETDTVTVPGEGTYVLNEDGSITFTPDPDFVGKTSGVKVRGYDSNGLTAETTYTPTVKIKVSYVDPLDDNKTVQGPDDSSTPGGTDITTTYEDSPGEESKKHPGYRFDGWEETIDPDDPSHYIRTAKYTPLHKIIYDPNGGTGEMDEDVYEADDANKPHKENTFTRKGYSFVGFKAYITDPTTGEETPIVDEKGNPIIFNSTNEMAEYFKDMPGGTTIRMEAQWEKDIWVKYIDEDGNTVYMPETFFPKGGTEPGGPGTPTKDGYTFLRWDKYVDEEGNITYVARWEKNKPTPPTPSKVVPSPTAKIPTPYTGDNFHVLPYVILICVAVIGGIYGFIKLRQNKK